MKFWTGSGKRVLLIFLSYYTQASPQVKSPWSESMNQLMRKLDQLNQDIEEALSANSSPSDTPCTPRKKQVGSLLAQPAMMYCHNVPSVKSCILCAYFTHYHYVYCGSTHSDLMHSLGISDLNGLNRPLDCSLSTFNALWCLYCHGWWCTHSCEVYAAYFVMPFKCP